MVYSCCGGSSGGIKIVVMMVNGECIYGGGDFGCLCHGCRGSARKSRPWFLWWWYCGGGGNVGDNDDVNFDWRFGDGMIVVLVAMLVVLVMLVIMVIICAFVCMR